LFFYKNNLIGTPRIHKTPNALLSGSLKWHVFANAKKVTL